MPRESSRGRDRTEMPRAIGTLSLIFSAVAAFTFGAPGHACPLARGSDRCAVHDARARAVKLAGVATVRPTVDRERAGRAEAFRLRVGRSGKATAVRVYLDHSSRARRVAVAIYAGGRAGPKHLLTRGSARRAHAGRWVGVGVRAVRVRAGRRYWLAVLGTGGRLAYRDRPGSGCVSVESAGHGLRTLPRRWRDGTRWRSCPLSAYVLGRPSRSQTPHPSPRPRPHPGGGGSSTTTTTGGSPTPSPGPTQTGCFAQPSACGYPDQSNTGVPAGTALTPSGSITASAPGVINGRDVTGSIEVTADNVTIENTRVTDVDSSGGAIHIDSGVTGTKIINSTVRGQSATAAVQYAVINSGSGTVASGLQMYWCAECWNGTGTLSNSYAIANGSISGAHYEAVYLPGGNSDPITLQHDTLLNPNEQTAGIFGDNHTWGPLHNVTITGNLVAAGGDNGAIVTGCNGDGATAITVTGNRLSYAYNRSMSQGSSNIAATNWSGNYRDDNLKPVGPTSVC